MDGGRAIATRNPKHLLDRVYLSSKERAVYKKHSKAIPKFRNEAEERSFWEPAGNDSTEYVDWSKGRIMAFPNLRRSTETISLRLPESLLNTIRAEAKRLDVPYQSLMKVWLAEKAAAAHK